MTSEQCKELRNALLSGKYKQSREGRDNKGGGVSCVYLSTIILGLDLDYEDVNELWKWDERGWTFRQMADGLDSLEVHFRAI